MDKAQTALRLLGISCSATEKISNKDGVAVYRAVSAEQSYILKTYENEADRREISNYRILQTMGIPTLKTYGSTGDALLMEDLAQSETLRLGQKDDMDDPAVAARLADWYGELHKRGRAYVAAHGQGMYDEADALTEANMNAITIKTGTAANPFWALLRERFGAVRAALESAERTLNYNDYYYTNMVVAKDKSAAFMFDYNLLGKGYAYADLRNVTSSLGKEAGAAFLGAYGGFDPGEALIDAVASPLTVLHMACQRPVFPQWAKDELEMVKNGALEAALRRLVSA